MKKVDVGEVKLYLGTAKEISHAYRHLRDSGEVLARFTGTPRVHYGGYYGLLVENGIMQVVRGDIALAIIYGL